MNASAFRSLGPAMFKIVASKRQALVAATKRLNEVLDADPCDHVCTCSARPAYNAAVKAESDAHAEVVAAEAAWAEFNAAK